VLKNVNLSTQLSRYGSYGQPPITMPKKQSTAIPLILRTGSLISRMRKVKCLQ